MFSHFINKLESSLLCFYVCLRQSHRRDKIVEFFSLNSPEMLFAGDGGVVFFFLFIALSMTMILFPTLPLGSHSQSKGQWKIRGRGRGAVWWEERLGLNDPQYDRVELVNQIVKNWMHHFFILVSHTPTKMVVYDRQLDVWRYLIHQNVPKET